MRIANNMSRRSSLTLGALLVTVLTASAGSSFAADAASLPPPMSGVPAPAAMADTSAPLSPMVSPASLAPNTAPPAADIGKTVTALETKISDGAKAVVKNLDASTDAMTLEDLNSARQTVARIEAIIDVEKHLAELEKLRNERNGVHSASSLANLIPASTLQPPPSMTHSMPVIEHDAPKPILFSSPEISRIMGSEGHYTAVLRVNGEMKTVRAGDTLPGNTTVQSIAASSVVLDEAGKSKTLHVKNVDAIYSAMR